VFSAFFIDVAVAQDHAAAVELLFDRSDAPLIVGGRSPAHHPPAQLLDRRSPATFINNDDYDVDERRYPATTTAARYAPRSTVPALTISTRLRPSSTPSPTPKVPGPILTDPNAGTVVDPIPFDGAVLATNLTQDCSSFLRGVVDTEAYRACAPLSLLIQGSSSYFDILRKGAFSIATVVAESCAPDAEACERQMDKFADSLIAKDNCEADNDAGNPIIAQAYAGLKAYRAIRDATCIKSSKNEGGTYCYVEAVTNRQTPDDARIYFIPLGTQLPEDSRPNCSPCLQQTMDAFAQNAGKKGSALGRTYASAAALINQNCGANYVVSAVQAAEGAASSMRSTSPLLVAALLGVVTILVI